MDVLKVVLCRVTGQPVALVNVDKATRAISVAGAYTANGDAINVVEMKASADKRKIAKFIKTFGNIPESLFDEKTGTFSLL